MTMTMSSIVLSVQGRGESMEVSSDVVTGQVMIYRDVVCSTT